MTLTLTRRVRCYRVVRRSGRPSRLAPVVVPPGVYSCRRIPSPLGDSPAFTPWIVLEGEVGQSELGWRRFEGPDGSVAFAGEGEDDGQAIPDAGEGA